MVFFRVYLLLFLFLTIHTSAYSQKGKGNFRTVINQAKYHDQYDPKVQEGLFVTSIQTGTHADYTTDTIERFYAGYYVTRDAQIFIVIPEFEGEYLSIGAEYQLGNKIWFGAEFLPENADFHLYIRGVNYRSSAAKLHYELGITIYDEAKAYNLAGGYQTHPFNGSRNTFLDFKGEYRLYDGDYTTVGNMSLIGEIGHGWARFAEVNGLELYGSIGLEYSSINVSYDTPFLEDDYSDSDVDLRLVVGVLYKTPI